MKSLVSSRFGPSRLRWVLLLSCLILLAGGCAAMSRAKLGISGDNHDLRNPSADK